MIAAVVLAAGASARMGEPKALLQRRDGKRYVDAIAATARAAGCEHVVVVVGPPHGDVIRATIGEATAWNPDPARGMLSSVQAGIAALPAHVSAALIWPVDIPFVGEETVRDVIAQHGTIIVPTHNNRGGHPLFIVRAHFNEIAALDPAQGLKALIDAHRDEVLRLPVDDAGVLVDVDTPDDYARTRD